MDTLTDMQSAFILACFHALPPKESIHTEIKALLRYLDFVIQEANDLTMPEKFVGIGTQMNIILQLFDDAQEWHEEKHHVQAFWSAQAHLNAFLNDPLGWYLP